jgi:hypothetical protein
MAVVRQPLGYRMLTAALIIAVIVVVTLVVVRLFRLM